mmetsp:Transcript_14092/g.21277  ORF Transcript_14092/g.21277 Transcript_14092/m.21277 type:complete len:612 (+) Transcript_14092:87-1922(+)|eukprot:CAMPEP_0197318884 /NCGR_PEP_ID=MMETSP0891-20130614/52743_1 /TAXON_ID=44058 ORGANISM="Aureoumbra lagunensis, Strain CCMP1510" /NCGR_SAMPLE_ID=MMETSP0891 /ASSEMBLY_ACC=CAM_ASM_000534 /LENGTH=611 /DNA_ID=CAMNT_0042809533 /DNA_START=27 /DNA_END=1862 /DNA_ORIENTATION=+
MIEGEQTVSTSRRKRNQDGKTKKLSVEEILSKAMRGERLSSEEFFALDPLDYIEDPMALYKDMNGIEYELQFPSPLPILGQNMKMLPMPTVLNELVKHRKCSLDDPKYYKLIHPPMLGIDVDLISEDMINPNPKPPNDPLHADDIEILEEVARVLDDTSILGPRYYKTKGLAIPENIATSWDERGKNDTGLTGSIRSKSLEAKQRDEAVKDAVWLKNTYYLSNNQTESVHAFTSRDDQKRNIERKIKKEASLYSSSTYEKINADFDAVKQPATSDKPGIQVEWELPLLPDTYLVADNHILVDFDIDPAQTIMEKQTDKNQNILRQIPHRIISRVENISAKKGGKKMSVALSIINTKSLQTIEDSTCSKNDKIQAEYQWARQYQLRFVPDDSQRMVLFIHENHATYLTEGVDKRIECDRCRMPEAARLDNEIRHHTWNGQTSILYHNTSAFTARERNQKREKRRIYNHNVSEDEDDEDILDPAITDGQQEMNNNNNNEKKDHQPQDDDEMDLDDSFEQKHVTNYEQLPPTALPNQKQSSVAEADIFGDDEEDDAAKVTEKQRQPTSTAMETDIFGDDDSDEDQVADKNKEQTNKETAAMDDLFGGDDSDDDL